ncbi:MAG: cyclase family protein [Thermoflexus sp.]|uniref:cyclase family protein n=1 Tax=Thermoflexus sp. TaxID=1969742 RepID=UPI0025DE1BD1|nr:cyclase family protein [Thermoflexus sp.]MCS6964569.1 cyclase family protein [Thermoflexus sp.]MDW8184928.1 cyclase family protein [Anaerolineae bacterium]
MNKHPLFIAFLCFAVATSACGRADSGKKTITYSRVVDLSHVIDTNIPLWPGDPPVEFEVVADFATHGYYLRRFSIGEHSATHMNASNSFVEGGRGIDAYPPESLVVPAVVIDIREKAAANPDYALTVEDVLDWERKHGRIPKGSVVILFTGWQYKWSDPKAFMGLDAEGGLHFPGFEGTTARFLFEERGVAGLGTDTHGLDPGQDTTFATNVEVARRNGIALECLTNLDQLPPTGATLVLGILRLKNGSGTPLSVMAFVP